MILCKVMKFCIESVTCPESVEGSVFYKLKL